MQLLEPRTLLEMALASYKSNQKERSATLAYVAAVQIAREAFRMIPHKADGRLCVDPQGAVLLDPETNNDMGKLLAQLRGGS